MNRKILMLFLIGIVFVSLTNVSYAQHLNKNKIKITSVDCDTFKEINVSYILGDGKICSKVENLKNKVVYMNYSNNIFTDDNIDVVGFYILQNVIERNKEIVSYDTCQEEINGTIRDVMCNPVYSTTTKIKKVWKKPNSIFIKKDRKKHKKSFKVYNLRFDKKEVKYIKYELKIKRNPLSYDENIKYDIVITKDGLEVVLDPWLNSDWGVRNPIIINATNTNEELRNFTMSVNINVSNLTAVNSDCSDFRVSWYNASSGLEEEIPIGKVENCNSSSTSFNLFFKAPFIDNNTYYGSTNTTYFLYHGNTKASSNWNNQETFLVYDDFNDNSIDTNYWTVKNWDQNNGGWDKGIDPIETGGRITFTSTASHYWGKGLWKKTGFSTDNNKMRVRMNITYVYPAQSFNNIYAYFYDADNWKYNNYYGNIYHAWGSSTTVYTGDGSSPFFRYNNALTDEMVGRVYNSTTSGKGLALAYTNSSWSSGQLIKLSGYLWLNDTWVKSNMKIYNLDYSSKTPETTYSIDTLSNTTKLFNFSDVNFMLWGSGYDTRYTAGFDDVVVWNYVENEPTLTLNYTEEKVAGNWNVTTISSGYQGQTLNYTATYKIGKNTTENQDVYFVWDNQMNYVDTIDCSSTCVANSTYSLSYLKNIAINITDGEKVNYYWSAYNQHHYINSTTYQTTLYEYLVDDCSNYSNVIFNFTFWDEFNTSYRYKANNTFEALINLTDFGTHIGILEYNADYVELCANVPNTTFNADIYVLYGVNGTSYRDRRYFLINENIDTTQIQNVSLYQIKVIDSQPLIVYALDSSLQDPYNDGDVVVRVTRNYLSEDIYRTVDSCLTSSVDGSCLVYIYPNDAWYKFLFLVNGVLVDSSNRLQIFETSKTFTVNPEGISSIIDSIGISISTQWVNSTNTYSVTFSDTSKLSSVELNVYEVGMLDTTLACSQTATATGSSLSIYCSVPGSTYGKTYFAEVYGIFSDGNKLLLSQEFISLQENNNMGDVGLFLTMIIVMLLAFAGMWLAGIYGLVLFTILGFVLSYFGKFLYLGQMGSEIIISIAVIGIVILMLVSVRNG